MLFILSYEEGYIKKRIYYIFIYLQQFIHAFNEILLITQNKNELHELKGLRSVFLISHFGIELSC